MLNLLELSFSLFLVNEWSLLVAKLNISVSIYLSEGISMQGIKLFSTT